MLQFQLRNIGIECALYKNRPDILLHRRFDTVKHIAARRIAEVFVHDFVQTQLIDGIIGVKGNIAVHGVDDHRIRIFLRNQHHRKTVFIA